MRRGWLLIAIGLAMIGFDLTIAHRFSVLIGEGFRLQLGALLGALGAVVLIATRLSEESAALTTDELARWGSSLERVTPQLLALCETRASSAHIAAAVAREHAIPETIVLKYLAAVAAHASEIERRSDQITRAD